MNEWWTQPLRAVTLEFPASDVTTIDVEAIVNETHAGNVNALCVFAIGYYPGGTAFYQSCLAPHYPGLGQRDLLSESIQAARRNGQIVIAYIASIWGDRQMYMRHPDWAQRKTDDEVTTWDANYSSVAMCPNSPYREYLANVAREIGERYDVDGFYFDEPSFQSWCNCTYCREKFMQECSRPLPTVERWGDPVFRQFLAWRKRQIADWRRDLYQTVKREGRGVFFQGAFPLANLPDCGIRVANMHLPHSYQARFGVTWHVPLAHGTDLTESTQIGDLLHVELYRRSVREPLWWYGLSLRYGRSISRDKRTLVLNMMGQTPFDLYGLPEAELRLSVAEILANDSDPLFARYYPDRVDQVAWELVYECLHEAKKLTPYLVGRESVKYAALLFSETTIEWFDQVQGQPSHLGELKGFAKAALQEHLLFDVLTETDLADRLNDYKVIVLPNVAYLSSAAQQTVRDFVARGGGLVASYQTGLYDDTAGISADNLAELFGVAYDAATPEFQGFDVYMRMETGHDLPVDIPGGKHVPSGGLVVNVQANGAQVIARVIGGSGVMYGKLGEVAGPPAIVTHRHGAGRVVFFAPQIGNTYLEFGVPDHRQLIATAIRWAAGVEAPIRLQNAPATMALTAFRQRSGLIVHLVNSVRDEILPPITEVAPAYDVRLVIPVEKPPRQVISLAGDPLRTWSVQGGSVLVDFASIQYHAVIAVQFSESK